MIDATFDLRDVERGLAKLSRAFGPDLKKVFQAARKPVMDDQREHKKRMEGPDGKWAPRAAATQAKRAAARRAGKKRRGKLLGRLPTAVRVIIESRRIAVVSRVPWSSAHNDPEGATVGRGAKLPGRPFLWISQKLVNLMVSEIMDFVGKSWP